MNGSRIKRSLLAEMTTLGVDDWLLILNVQLALLIVGVLRFYHWAWVTLALHFVLVAVTRYQPRILLVYWKYMAQRNSYCDWCALPLTRGMRPRWMQALVGRTDPSSKDISK
jgi:hypothetical protein